MNTRTRTVAHITIGAVIALLILPVFANAQSSASSSAALRVAIQNAVLKDPSSGTIPPAQLNALIDALTAQAQSQGLTPQEINYRPGQPIAGPAVATTSSCKTTFCSIAQVLGFSGPGASIIFIILIFSGILAVLAITLVLRHHHHHGHMS